MYKGALEVGVTLTITGTGARARADFVRIAEHVRVGPLADVSWLGSP